LQLFTEDSTPSSETSNASSSSSSIVTTTISKQRGRPKKVAHSGESFSLVEDYSNTSSVPLEKTNYVESKQKKIVHKMNSHRRFDDDDDDDDDNDNKEANSAGVVDSESLSPVGLRVPVSGIGLEPP
jgi:hypothetical protein